MRICPQCRAFYADAQLAFCLADGTPLIGIKPGSEKWHEGSRVIEEKAKAVSKQRRRLKWRRVALGAMTTLILTMVVVTSFTVETTPPSQLPPTASSSPSFPASWDPSLSPSSSPTASPTESPLASPSASPSPSSSSSPSLTASPSPTASPTPTPAPSPTVFKISGRVMSLAGPLRSVKISLEGSKLTSTTTDASGYYAFSELRAGGSYNITHKGQMRFTPSNRYFDNLWRDETADFFVNDATPPPTPTPTPPTPTPTPTPKPTPTATPPKQECSEADQMNALNSLRSFEPSWRRQILGERTKVVAEHQGNEASLGEIEFRYSFPKPCKAAVVSARYAWQVRTAGNVDFPGKSKSVPRQRTIACGKFLGVWACR